MIVQTRENKDLVIPKSLGNFVTEGSGGGGVSPEEAAEIASAVTAEAIQEYDTELQVDLEDIREAVSASSKDYYVDWAELRAMTQAERVLYFSELSQKFEEGYTIYAVGKTNADGYDIKLPLIEFRPESTGVAGWARFAGISTKNITGVTSGYNILYASYNSNGNTYPDTPYLDRSLEFYELPTASAEVKGGVKVGSGLTMVEETLMVDTTGLVTTGDLAPFIVQLSANTQAIEGLSGTTTDIAAISGQTSANTQDIVDLSGVTSGISSGLQELSGATQGIEQSVTTLSGAVKEDFYLDAAAIYSAATDADRTAIWELAEQKYLAGHNVYLKGRSTRSASGYDIIIPLVKYQPYQESDPYYSGQLDFVVKDGNPGYFYDINFYHRGARPGSITQGGVLSQTSISTGWVYPTASSSRKGCIKVGSGLTMSGETMSVKVGDGLGFSGDTLVVSGGSSNTKVVMLNKLSQQERLDLYNELAALYDYDASGWSSAYTEDMYAFYLDLRSYTDQDLAQTADRYEGFYPMECCRMHPSDYGGAAFFTGVEQSREGNGQLICIRYVIDYEGNVDGPSTWWNNPPGEQLSITTVSFGNDSRGGLTYDADNGYFIYDSNNVATGDTQNYCEDLIDYLFLTSLFGRNGKYDNYYLINVHSLDVITGGTYNSYTAPTLSIRDITPYTIGDYTFSREVTFKYTDWILTIDITDVNMGANLRISAV